jgi:hypothetical protein
MAFELNFIALLTYVESRYQQTENQYHDSVTVRP